MRKILWKLGLTREERTELSDLLYETAIAKKLQKFENNTLLFTGVSLDMYPIRLKGQDLTFLVDNPELYNTIENGQTVEVAYRKAYNTVQDYKPPNFTNKQQLQADFSEYRLAFVKPVQQKNY